MLLPLLRAPQSSAPRHEGRARYLLRAESRAAPIGHRALDALAAASGRRPTGSSACSRSPRRRWPRSGSTARPYSLTALQRFAACPYQFQLAAIYRLAPLEAPAPLQRLDPLTRGSLFHEIQTAFFRAARRERPAAAVAGTRRAPRGSARLGDQRGHAARPTTTWRRRSIACGRTRSTGCTRDLRLWLEQQLVRRRRALGARALRVAFGLPPTPTRDAARCASRRSSTRRVPAARLDRPGRAASRRHARCASPTTRPGRTARRRPPSSTAAACCSRCSTAWRSKRITGETVDEGRLSYCTTAGQFTSASDPARRAHPAARPRGARDHRSRDRTRHAGRQARPARTRLRLLRLPAGVRARRGAPHRPQAGGARPRRAEEDAVTRGRRRRRRSPAASPTRSTRRWWSRPRPAPARRPSW